MLPLGLLGTKLGTNRCARVLMSCTVFYHCANPPGNCAIHHVLLEPVARAKARGGCDLLTVKRYRP